MVFGDDDADGVAVLERAELFERLNAFERGGLEAGVGEQEVAPEAVKADVLVGAGAG